MSILRPWPSPQPGEPLSLEDLEVTARTLGQRHLLKPDERRAVTESLETTVIIRSQNAWREVTEASIALFLIREHGLHLGRKNELDLPMETWEEYLDFLGRRGMARSTSFKHLSSLLIFHKGLGRSLFEALRIPGGVATIHHVKSVVNYDRQTGEILGAKSEAALEKLPLPGKDLVTRINQVFDEIELGGPRELEFTPRKAIKLLRQDYGGEPQINFYFTMGPTGLALAFYYCPDGKEDYRGIVGLDPMPQTVAAKLRDLVRATEKDPTPWSRRLFCKECGAEIAMGGIECREE